MTNALCPSLQSLQSLPSLQSLQSFRSFDCVAKAPFHHMLSTIDDTLPLLAAPTPRLAALLGGAGRARALQRWLWREGLPRELPEEIPGLGRRVWQEARPRLVLPEWHLVSERRAADGTRKLAIDFAGAVVETVLIPGPQRSTVCLSSQAGCTRSCAFCATATLGFRRQLSAAEIVAQYLLAQRLAPPGKPARNVVFMGMGEPFDNLDEVLAAVAILTQAPQPALSPAHVTVSTSGVVPAMRRFLAESTACLALSLNATTDELRQRLMPHNWLWPIAALLETLRVHAAGRVVFVEYVLFEEVNDGVADADRLATLLDGIAARVNLIPFNGFAGSTFRAPAPARVAAFQKRVAAAGLRCLVRAARGADIEGACGQLAGAVSS